MTAGHGIKKAAEGAKNVTDGVVDAVERTPDDVTDAVQDAVPRAGDQVHRATGSSTEIGT